MGRFSWIFTNFWHVDPTRLGLEHSWKPKQKLPKSETPRSIFKSRLDFITDKKIHQKSPKCSESQGTFGSTFCLKKKHPGTPLIVPSGKVGTCRQGTKFENLFRVSNSIDFSSQLCLFAAVWMEFRQGFDSCVLTHGQTMLPWTPSRRLKSHSAEVSKLLVTPRRLTREIRSVSLQADRCGKFWWFYWVPHTSHITPFSSNEESLE